MEILNNQEIFRKLLLKEDLQSECLSTIDIRIDRWLEIQYQEIIADHHFASASSECIKLYRDGYFIGTVMMTHAINEGIIKFVAERNTISQQNTDGKTKSIEQLIYELQEKKIVSEECSDASLSIWRSYRNDVHHMNPSVSSVPFQELAQLNIKRLSVIETEIFSCDYSSEGLAPHQPLYWDKNPDGTYKTWLRHSF